MRNQMSDDSDATAGLRRAVELVRAEKHSDLDAKLIAEILDIQFDFAEDRSEAEKLTEQTISRFVADAERANEGRADA